MNDDYKIYDETHVEKYHGYEITIHVSDEGLDDKDGCCGIIVHADGKRKSFESGWHFLIQDYPPSLMMEHPGDNAPSRIRQKIWDMCDKAWEDWMEKTGGVK